MSFNSKRQTLNDQIIGKGATGETPGVDADSSTQFDTRYAHDFTNTAKQSTYSRNPKDSMAAHNSLENTM